MNTVLTVASGVALCVALAGPHIASAGISSPALLTDGSLATTVTPDKYDLITASSTKNSTALDGWTISGSVDIVPNSYWQSSTGTFSVDLIGSPGLGTISQDVSTSIGTIYTLTFDMSVDPENLTGEAGDTKHLVVTATPVAIASPDFAPALTPSPTTMTFDGTINGPGGVRTKTNMRYVAETFQFTAASTLTTLSLGATMPSGLPGTFNANNVFCGPVVDNLVLVESGVTPLPEPASLALFGAGGVALLGRRRRRT